MALHISCMTGLRPTMRSPLSSAGSTAGTCIEAGGLEGAFDHLAEVLQVHGLDQVIEGAALHRLDGGLGGAVGGDEDDRPLRVEGVDFAEDLQAVAVGQLQVEDDHVGFCSRSRREPSAAVAAVRTLTPSAPKTRRKE